MRPIDVQKALELIPESRDEIAGRIGVPVATLAAWESGAKTPRGRAAERLAWFAAAAERDCAVEAAGIPSCEWIADWEARTDPKADLDQIEARYAALDNHTESCEICRRRASFVEARFPPMPPLPMGRGVHVLGAVFGVAEGLPAVLRPAFWGAALLALIVLVRAVFAIPIFIPDPATLFELAGAVAAAAGAGAAGGLAYSIFQPLRLRLGRVGDYLLGLVVVGAYMVSLAVAGPIAFGADLLDLRESRSWWVLGFVTLLFGGILGHSWFHKERIGRAR